MSISDEYNQYLSDFLSASEGNGSKESKIQFTKLQKIFSKLRESKSLSQLLINLDSRSANEQLWIATHLLVHDEALARGLLIQLSKGDSMVAFSAKLTLQEWDKGNLTYLIE